MKYVTRMCSPYCVFKNDRHFFSKLQAREPWDLIGVDLFGPVPETPRGYKYVLTATCLFSKWVEAEPIPDKSSDSVFSIFMKLFHRWGLPRRIITDQGKEFNNHVSISISFYMFKNKILYQMLGMQQLPRTVKIKTIV